MLKLLLRNRAYFYDSTCDMYMSAITVFDCMAAVFNGLVFRDFDFYLIPFNTPVLVNFYLDFTTY